MMRYCFYLWLRLGNNKFENLREFLILPSKRTLQIFREHHVPEGDGYRRDVFLQLQKLWSDVSKSRADWDCILSWDATGYAKKIKFDKHSGKLMGFACSPESFSVHHMYANKVWRSHSYSVSTLTQSRLHFVLITHQVCCFLVSSPELDIKIRFPVAYYHCSTLDSEDIRRQWEEVMHGLDSIGLNVVALVCDGASEHAKFFNLVLEDFADEDPTLLVRRGGAWAVSDAPHLMKKFRNNWMSSGLKAKHTRLLSLEDNFIMWDIMAAVYKLATTLEDGTSRMFRSLQKLTWDVIEPCSIMKLRVSLATVPFSKPVRDFVRCNINQVSHLAQVRVQDVEATLEFMTAVDELWQIMNSRVPITWSEEVDDNGNAIGLRDKCNTDKGFTLHFFAKKFGVSVNYLIEVSGLESGDSVPAPGTELIVDRLDRLVQIASFFMKWKTQVDSQIHLTKKQRERMFITHWLYDDLRRCCFSLVGLMKMYVTKSNRKWIPRRFNQDPIESVFGQIRNLAGSNSNMTFQEVDIGFSELRALGLKKIIRT